MSQASGPGWHSGALRSQVASEPQGEPSQVASQIKGESQEIKADHDPAYVNLKVKQQVRRLQPLPLPLTRFIRMEQSLILGSNASP
jgi:hypothetical protein